MLYLNNTIEVKSYVKASSNPILTSHELFKNVSSSVARQATNGRRSVSFKQGPCPSLQPVRAMYRFRVVVLQPGKLTREANQHAIRGRKAFGNSQTHDYDLI